MGRELGRISGPLLADNLRRNGADLAFDNQVLYLDVTNNRVGFNTSAPVTDLYTPTSIRTTELIVSDTANLGNWTINTSTFQYLLNTSIKIRPDQTNNPQISTPGLSTSKLYLYDNTVSTYNSNSDLNFTANGNGSINFSNDIDAVQVSIDGNLHTTGNIRFDGNVTLGNQSTDTITVVGEINSDILPQVLRTLVTPITEQLLTEALDLFISEDSQDLFTDPPAPYYDITYLYNLGSNALQWTDIYANTLISSTSITSRVTATNSYLGELLVTRNNISNTTSSNNLYLSPSGTGLVNFNSVNYIQDSNIYIPSTGNFVLSSTGNGYIKFGGTNGTIFPAGGINQRPVSPEIGQLRYNVDLHYSEIWEGTTWIPLQGTTNDLLSTNQVVDTMWAWDIILG
jgi:hypothetical protein